MKYNFDMIIDRSGSGDLKHEVLKARYGRDDLIARCGWLTWISKLHSSSLMPSGSD